jgi:hypothetical protein
MTHDNTLEVTIGQVPLASIDVIASHDDCLILEVECRQKRPAVNEYWISSSLVVELYDGGWLAGEGDTGPDAPRTVIRLPQRTRGWMFATEVAKYNVWIMCWAHKGHDGRTEIWRAP